MAEAIFGLVGVALGAVLQGGWSWWMERRREGWAAKRSGRLFGPALFRCGAAASSAVADGATWDELGAVIDANLAPWPEHSEVFAGTLDWDAWFDIYVAVRALERYTWEVPSRAGKRFVRASPEGLYVWQLGAAATKGAMRCMSVGLYGVKRQRVRRALTGLRYRLRPPDQEKLLQKALDRIESSQPPKPPAAPPAPPT